jgi:hypothetical protein
MEVDPVTGATSTLLSDLAVHGIAFDPDGYLHLSIPSANRIVRIGPGLPGDMDGSGSVDADDVDAFVRALLRASDAPLPIQTADMNVDGCVDGRDVTEMVEMLLQ